MSDVAEVPAYDDPATDPRRGVLWAGAAPVAAGDGRVGVGVGGGGVAKIGRAHV